MNMESLQYQQALTSLLAGFQCAILDLSVDIEEKKASMSPDDLESAHYVVGMVTMNSANCELLLSWETGIREPREAEMIGDFLHRGQQFLNELKRGGFGNA